MGLFDGRIRKRTGVLMVFVLCAVAVMAAGCRKNGVGQNTTDTSGYSNTTGSNSAVGNTSENGTQNAGKADGVSGNGASNGSSESDSAQGNPSGSNNVGGSSGGMADITISDRSMDIEKVMKKVEGSETVITLKNTTAEIKGKSAKADSSTVTITGAGTYRISGTLDDGRIIVSAGKNDKVVLILDNAYIRCSSDSAIYVENSDKTVIYLADGTENTVISGNVTDVTTADDTVGSSGSTAVTANVNGTAVTANTNGTADTSSSAARAAVTDASGGAIYAKDDLAVAGGGKLIVGGYINNGIQCSDDLTIDCGIISITAVNNGIKGKDSVTVRSGIIDIAAGNDGIKSDNDTDADCGNVIIENGSIKIVSDCDGISAENALLVYGGDIDIVTGEGSGKAQTKYNNDMGGWGGFRGDKNNRWDMDSAEDESRKGLKTGSMLAVYGGTIKIDSYDDAAHSDGNVAIYDGRLAISSGDDGVHGNDELAIYGGTVTVAVSYEGLEANQIVIEGGRIDITSSDDGINANGGSNMGWGFRGSTASSSNSNTNMPNLIICGGELYVNAGGDGLDSNGNLIVEGGLVIVDGPVDNGNGALDCGSESGGRCTISGGTVLALGSSGMAESFDSTSTQCSFRYYCTSAYSAGDIISIENADGKLIYSYTAKKSGSCVIFSSPELEKGGKYTVSVGTQQTEAILSSVSTDIGNGGMGGFGGFGGPGGFPGGNGGFPGGNGGFPGGNDSQNGGFPGGNDSQNGSFPDGNGGQNGGAPDDDWQNGRYPGGGHGGNRGSANGDDEDMPQGRPGRGNGR